MASFNGLAHFTDCLFCISHAAADFLPRLGKPILLDTAISFETGLLVWNYEVMNLANLSIMEPTS